MKDIAGRTVVVTGASSGIGAEIALAFGRHGARVAVHYRSDEDGAKEVAAAIEESGGSAQIFGADLAVSAQAAAFAEDVLEAFGRVHIVVNSVGGFLIRVPLADADDEFIDAVFDLNARSMLTVNRRFVAHFRAEGGGGNIINLTSQAARSGATGGAGAYGATKAYVSTYTRALAKELATEGIRVNAISPGVIDTPFHHGQTSPEMLAQLTAGIPMGRLGTAEDCAGTALYLASDELSRYVTGQVIEVNGGLLMP